MKFLASSIAVTLLLGAAAAVNAAGPEKDGKGSAAKQKAERVAEYYQIDPITTPPGIDAQIGALGATPDGRLVAAFHHGEVAFYNPKNQEWKIFAEGLHEPLGILAEKDGSVLVMQRPELTRLRDTTGKGVADSYETVWDGFGMTGNYHEFAFGPVPGPNGKLYIALNLASNGDTVHKEIRGEWTPVGLPREQFYADWKKASKDAGRMYSRVPWRGWVMELNPSTGVATPYCCGFRSPDGINFDASGNLLVSDNQGDWRGACELFVLKKDGFYGHPASLVWRKDWTGEDPLKVSIDKLNELRTPAPIWFPYGSYANSATQMLPIPKTPAWGPFGGQTLIGEMNAPKILRVMPEQVDGVWEGATVEFISTDALKRGLHRFAFIGDTLYLGRTHLSWAGAEGIAAVKPTGKTPFDPLEMHITPHGFRFEFTEALDPNSIDPALWPAKHYYYLYHATYGSPEIDKTDVKPVKVTLSNGGKTADVELPEMKTDVLYDFDLARLKSVSGATPLNPRIAYTVRKVPKN